MHNIYYKKNIYEFRCKKLEHSERMNSIDYCMSNFGKGCMSGSDRYYLKGLFYLYMRLYNKLLSFLDDKISCLIEDYRKQLNRTKEERNDNQHIGEEVTKNCYYPQYVEKGTIDIVSICNKITNLLNELRGIAC